MFVQFNGTEAVSYSVLSFPHSLKLVLTDNGITAFLLLKNGIYSTSKKNTGTKKQAFSIFCVSDMVSIKKQF
jgi:hypothetical protein